MKFKIKIPPIKLPPNFPKIKFSLPPLPLGIDISDFYIRAVRLEKERGKNFVFGTCYETTLPEGVIKDGEFLDREALIRLLKETVYKVSGESGMHREVIADLPEPKTFIKMVTFNWPAGESAEVTTKKRKEDIKAKETILWRVLGEELKEDVPIPLEEANIDYHIIKGDLKKVKAGEEMKLIVGIVSKKISEDYTAVLEDAGLIPIALEIEGFAIARALIQHVEGKQKLVSPNSIKIILDLGATRTGLIIYHQDLVRYSLSIPVSGRKITQAIADKKKISFEEAEKLKIAAQTASEKDPEIYALVTSSLEEIINRVKEAIIFCQFKISSAEMPEIILCGGGTKWPGLPEMLSEKLNVKATIGNPWINFTEQPTSFQRDKSLSYTTAIGLALGGYYDYS